MLREAAARVHAAGVRTDVVLVWEDPVHALLKTAADRGSHVIVVGSHGEGPLSGAMGRHTPYELLHRSTVPVLVVPRRT
jgi:nucleotide-binding universal stress UspA family protein